MAGVLDETRGFVVIDAPRTAGASDVRTHLRAGRFDRRESLATVRDPWDRLSGRDHDIRAQPKHRTYERDVELSSYEPAPPGDA